MHDASNIPVGWKRFTLRNLIKSAVSGPSPTCEERNIYGDREWGLLKTTAITWEGWDASAHKVLPAEYWGNRQLAVSADDIVITKAGPRHRVGVVTHVNYAIPRVIVSGKMVLLRPDTNLVEPRILAGLLSQRAPQKFLDERTTGMAESQVNFSNSTLRKTPLLVPPLGEQRRMAEILDALDAQISTISLLVGKLQTRRRGLTEHLITSTFGEKTPLAMHLAQAPKNGYSPKEVDEWTGLQALGLGCLTPDGFHPRQLKNVPAKDGRNAAALLNDGDLLMSRANTRDLVGLVGIYRDIGCPCIYPDLMMRLVPAHDCRSEYLELLLLSNDVRRQIQAIAQGTSESMVKISGSSVGHLRVTVPSLAEQDRVLVMVDAIQQEADIHKYERNKLKLLKQGLMEDLLTGRIRVSEAEAVLECLQPSPGRPRAAAGAE
ncbi:restriction endonuclease subunit S [Microbispora sp. H10830]|uniref:restriction endonuclease subunit S n=1 Tax=Microbispora sp. H10830 TaxID=2729109 RepID=UPI0016022F5D|nr:restriction endonuclease subunit S [Microbispora sp. H10830]